MNINQEANMDNLEHMEPRHFALPAAFVLTLMAFLFFGMTNPTRPSLSAASPEPSHEPWPATVMKIVEPPLVVPDDPDPFAKPANGGGGQLRPTSPDELQPFDPSKFVVPVEPPRLQPKRPVNEIGPFGLSPGEGEGPGIGRERVPSWKELDQPPRARAQASPVYPVQEKTSGITGTVEVEFTVDETGAVVNPWVVSSTRRSFEEPTLRAVEKWRFVPGRRLGQVVSFRMRVPVLFNLND
jgi:TonB family protein